MLKKGLLPLFIVNILGILIFGTIFALRKNVEFVGYIVVIIVVALVILKTYHKVQYSNAVLWGLTLWSFMHMAGGGLFINGTRLYSQMLIPIVGEPYLIFKYDQLVHIIGFAVATLLMYVVIKPHLKKGHPWVALGIVLVAAGTGLGALNEVIEFFITVLVPENGVGGYENTSLDLVSNLIGALASFFMIYHKEKKKS